MAFSCCQNLACSSRLSVNTDADWRLAGGSGAKKSGLRLERELKLSFMRVEVPSALHGSSEEGRVKSLLSTQGHCSSEEPVSPA